jgi:chromosomal replication initiation ATPase DnaA
MEGKAIKFIEEKGGKFAICEEAINILNNTESPFSVVAICGPYSTGKSYLRNSFMKKFSIGLSTRGIYMWSSQ